MEIGQAIKRIRKEQNLQSNDLAEIIGVVQSEVSLVENGKRDLRLSTVAKYALGLGMRPSELVRIAEEAL
jgi:XRE family transcriptional regulator, fatty acid utilization regulator